MNLPRRLLIGLQVLTCTLLACNALAARQVPEKLLGVWTTEGTTLKGDVVTSGEGIYLDVDGVGALVVRNGGSGASSRFVVSNYIEDGGRLEVDVTEGGQVVRHLTLNYDAAQNALVSADQPGTLYHRRKLEMSPDVRAALGLETRPLSVPSVLAPRAAGGASAVQ